MMLPVLGLSLQLATASVQPTPDTGPVFHARNGQTAVALPPAASAEITMDGRLDEPVWSSAARLTGFSMYRPVDQQAAPDSTEVLVWYSQSALYLGVRAFETHGPVRATLADRDRVSNDDHVEIHLDTFDERRRAFVFIVNPLGIQADGTKAEGGGFIPGSNVAPGQTDLSPDFQWQSRGEVNGGATRSRSGFRSAACAFPPADRSDWGLQVIRNVQHSGYRADVDAGAYKAPRRSSRRRDGLEGMHGMRHGVDVTTRTRSSRARSRARRRTALPGA